MQAVVRRLRASDVRDLQRGCYSDQSLDAVQTYANWCLRQMDLGRLVRLVAEVDGRVIANGQLTLQGEQAEIGSLVVALQYRRRGIGRQLLRALVAEARHQGIRSLVLAVSEEQPWLRAWYEREGFGQASERVLPRDEHVWVLRMALEEGVSGT